jgi:hypothetical protein
MASEALKIQGFCRWLSHFVSWVEGISAGETDEDGEWSERSRGHFVSITSHFSQFGQFSGRDRYEIRR